MSYTYNLHGARYLRKYTASERTSCYAYMADVRKIANSLCNVPWERASRDYAACNTLHTDEGLDWNEPERERFDAAEWCADHSDGMHRAFAQAACYVFDLPESARGIALEKVAAVVTSDPFNPYGARISCMVSDTLEIPMACETVRTGDAANGNGMYHAPDEDGMGVAPRLYVSNANGTQTWYSNSETAELEPASGVTILTKRYLFVFVCLENYNRGRDGWIEGSSFIENDVAITLAAESADLTADDINELSPPMPTADFAVVRGGVSPLVPAGACVGVRRVICRADATLVADEIGDQSATRDASGVAAAAALSRLYALFYAGDGARPVESFATLPTGARFDVTRTSMPFPAADSDTPIPTDVFVCDSSVLVLPFVLPRDTLASRVTLSFGELACSTGARFNVWAVAGYSLALAAEVLNNPGLHDGEGFDATLLGTITGGASATFDLGEFAKARTATLVISGWLPPEGYDLTTGGKQGTGVLLPTSVTIL